jgi:hypothetical protein
VRQTIHDPNNTAVDFFTGSSLSSDGNTALLTAADVQEGLGSSVSISVRSGNTWTPQQTLHEPSGGTVNDAFGGGVLSSDGNTALVPAVLASGGGRVFVFHRTGTT